MQIARLTPSRVRGNRPASGFTLLRHQEYQNIPVEKKDSGNFGDGVIIVCLRNVLSHTAHKPECVRKVVIDSKLGVLPSQACPLFVQ